MTTLLLVDDNQTLTDVYAEGLTREGFEVITADSGLECMETLKTLQPDIILLDIMMPDMDGWETLHKIRDIPQNHETPVLMVTAKALLAEDLATHGDLMDGFLLKPFSLAELAGRIRMFEHEREELIACVQKALAKGADSGTVRECTELASRVTVQKKLTDRIVIQYETAYLDRDDGQEIPEVVRNLQVTCKEKIKRLNELAGLLGLSEEPCIQQILESVSV